MFGILSTNDHSTSDRKKQFDDLARNEQDVHHNKVNATTKSKNDVGSKKIEDQGAEENGPSNNPQDNKASSFRNLKPSGSPPATNPIDMAILVIKNVKNHIFRIPVKQPPGFTQQVKPTNNGYQKPSSQVIDDGHGAKHGKHLDHLVNLSSGGVFQES